MNRGGNTKYHALVPRIVSWRWELF